MLIDDFKNSNVGIFQSSASDQIQAILKHIKQMFQNL